MALIRRVTEEKDVGMQKADERLEETEARLSAIYSQANRELTDSLNTFLAKFEEKDEKYRQMVLDGEMAEDEYLRWRQNSILRSAEMRAQIENLSIGLTRTDEMAVSAIRGDMPYVYTDSYNYGGFRGETLAQAAGYEYNQFAIYNAEAIRIIAAEDPDLIPWDDPELNEDKDLRWNRRHIQDAIAQGILQGESIPKIAKRLEPVVNMDRNAAVRTARTAYTSVQNQGRRDATARVKAAGIPMEEPWMSVMASNTRDTHLLLHGTLPNADGLYGEGIIPTGNLLRFPADPKGDPEQVYNCQCRVQSYIAGIDHSHDDELYEQFMQENYYEDWLEVKDYKADDRAIALERQRQLLSGEVENREAILARRRAERQAQKEPALRNFEQEIEEDAQEWIGGLNSWQKQLIEEYSELFYEPLNIWLRGQYTQEQERSFLNSYPDVSKRIFSLDSAINDFSLSNNITVYRTVDIPTDQLKVGSIFHDDAYMSTSIDANVVDRLVDLWDGNVIFEIDVPAGRGRGAYIADLATGAGQKEFLLARGSDIEIISIEEDERGIKRIRARWVGISMPDYDEEEDWD